jgi:hypothetical protein
MSFTDLTEILLFLAPGYIAIRLIRLWHPVKEKDSFHDFASSVLLGFFITGLLKLIDEKYLNFFLGSNISSYGLPSIRFYFVIIFSGVIVGIFLIGLLKLYRSKTKDSSILGFLSSGTDPVWLNINSSDNEDWAIVYLDDKSIYFGWIADYNYNPNFEDQDFLLSNAIRLDENLKRVSKINGVGVYLNTRDVKKIEFVKGSEK